MNENLNNQNKQEEVDLLQLFGFFEKKIKSIFRPFYNFFTAILNLLVNILQYLFKHYIKVSIIVITAFVLGFVYDSQKPKLYSSKMTVKPYFNSQYQLINNINYYNELALNEDYDKLSEVFNVDLEDARTILEFSYSTNIKNENARIQLFDEYKKGLDTSTISGLDYKIYSENLTELNAKVFDLRVVGTNKYVYEKLSKGFRSSFTSQEYTDDFKLKVEKKLKDKISTIDKTLSNIDSMRNVYLNVLSKGGGQKIEMLGASAVKLSDEQQQTKEFEMLKLQIIEQEKLNELLDNNYEKTVLIDVVSDFQKVGSPQSNKIEQMKYVFPFLGFVFIVLFFLLSKFKSFISTYKVEK